jgi:protein phosphatase
MPRWRNSPPPMAPPAPRDAPDRLDDLAQVLGYHRRQGLSPVICEEKHIGSRAMLVVCRDTITTQRRFGLVEGGIGSCDTRTGRPFFADHALEGTLRTPLPSALTEAGFWEAFETDGVCLDGEVMPWWLKAPGLLQPPSAPVGTAG